MSVENKPTPPPAEAVCFSAGMVGAVMGAGVIHAYLASQRRAPKIVAGVSVGALSAAAMQRAFGELEKAKAAEGAKLDSADPTIQAGAAGRVESARWTWFRKYVSYLSDSPLKVLWDCLPDPCDYLAELAPLKDPSLPNSADWIEREAEVRRHLHVQVKLGKWLSRIPISLGALGDVAVDYVRLKERYPTAWYWRLRNGFRFLTGITWLWACAVWHIAVNPQFFGERQFQGKGGVGFRPLFDWKVWRDSVGVTFIISAPLWVAASELANGLLTKRGLWPPPWSWGLGFALAVAVIVLVGPPLWSLFSKPKKGSSFVDGIAELIGPSLFTSFYLRLALLRLFNQDGKDACLSSDPMPALLVCAPLQILPSLDPGASNQAVPAQLWAQPKVGMVEVGMVEALNACLAVPGLLEPIHLKKVTKKDRDAWKLWVADKISEKLTSVDLVDGWITRENPLPALFSYFEQERERLGEKWSASPCGQLERTSLSAAEEGPVIHLVYPMPVRKKEVPPLLATPDDGVEPPLPDIVSATLTGRRLVNRRDNRQEVYRTNFITDLELWIDRVKEHSGSREPKSKRQPALPMTIHELAPSAEIEFKNHLQPTETEVLRQVAACCRDTMGSLYRKELGGNARNCPELMKELGVGKPAGAAPGMGEICRHCTKVIQAAPRSNLDILPPSFEEPLGNQTLPQRFKHLAQETPRIVFLASGGVFRGSFHIGMLGALCVAYVKPDLIAGASVGTLMGFALGSMFKTRDYAQARAKLACLTSTFIHVDEKIAITKPLKTALKDFGIRARLLRLSPNDLRKTLLRGSRKDPGLAATGAPPALIDAISDLFLIPYKLTAHIAATFVAGDIAGATAMFLKQARRHTIGRLGIRDAVIGSGLLENVLAGILGADQHPDIRSEAQPFAKENIAIFGTTVNLVEEWMAILGGEPDREARSYDFLKAALASSAFPAAFAPIRDSEIYPGQGRRDVFYSDGGMFDNLPFLPAIYVLGKIQAKAHEHASAWTHWEFLKKRHRSPDLFLVGALDANPERSDRSYQALLEISRRADELAANEKIWGFRKAARKIDGQLGRLVSIHGGAFPKEPEARPFLDGLVNFGTLSVFPTDADHLNGTFQFCRSAGLERDRVRLSIADGCFRTLWTLSEQGMEKEMEKDTDDPASRSVKALQKLGKIPHLHVRYQERANGECPFFESDADALASFREGKLLKKTSARVSCPFYDSSNKDSTSVYRECIKDLKHKDLTITPHQP